MYWCNTTVVVDKSADKPRCYVYYGLFQLLYLIILGAHASQGYSTWVCLWVCACLVQFFQTVTNWPRRLTDCLSVAIVITCLIASSRSYRIQVAAILANLLAILLAVAGARAYIHSRNVALAHVVFLLYKGFAILLCVTLYSPHAHLHHWTFPPLNIYLYNF